MRGYSNGKQGEYFSMSLEERKRQFEIFAEETGAKLTVMSCSDENLDTVLSLDAPRTSAQIGL